MPSHSFWKGYLKLSVVTCPVSMVLVITDGDLLRFQGFADEDADDLWAAHDMEALIPRSFHIIDLRIFAPAAITARLQVDAPFFLMPEDGIGVETYAIIRDTLRATGLVAISRLVLHQRSHAVVVEPRDTGIALWPLKDIDVAAQDDFLTGLPASLPDPQLKARLDQLIADRLRRWSPERLAPGASGRMIDLASARHHALKYPSRKRRGCAKVIVLADERRAKARRSARDPGAPPA